MIGFTPERLSLTEHVSDPHALGDLASRTSQPVSELAHLLVTASERLKRELAVPFQPIEVAGDGVRVSGIAGLVRVAPGLELEVAPKFLGVDDASWRADFFVVASISRFGRVLETDSVAGGFGERGDLATLVGRTGVRLYWANHRRPIRLYRRRQWVDFDVDGDVDAEALIAPSEDGFGQEAVSLERNNTFNQVLGVAFASLLPEIRDPDVRRQVGRVAASLPRLPRNRPGRFPSLVPARHRDWQTLYALGRQVMAGFGVDYVGRELLAPGYAVKTADAWQDLVSFALEAQLGTKASKRLASFPWAARGTAPVSVTPDVSVSFPSANALVDAKYKGRRDDDERRISSSDLYESYAFSRASGRSTVLLVYPRTAGLPRLALGSGREFDRVTVDDTTVVGVEVECRGLAQRGGFRTFATALVAALEMIVAGPLASAA
jgi:5-methylcytosine-specific restriction enzyme subunit McrC